MAIIKIVTHPVENSANRENQARKMEDKEAIRPDDETNQPE